MSSLLEESNFPQFYDHHFLVKSNSIVLIVLFLHLFCCTHSVVLIDWLIFNLASCRLSGHFGQTATWNYILTFNLPHWNFHFSSSSSSFAWTTHSSARRSLLFILFCIIYPAWKQERHITPSSLVHAQNGPQWPQHFFFLLKDAPTAVKSPASLSSPKAYTAQQMPSPESSGPSTEGVGKRVMASDSVSFISYSCLWTSGHPQVV